MDKFVTIDPFTDTHDERVEYPIDTIYPRDGYEPDPERIEALLTGNNAKGVPLIKRLLQLPPKVIEPEIPEEPEISEVQEEPKKPSRKKTKPAETAEEPAAD